MDLTINAKVIEAHRVVSLENVRVFSKRIGVSHEWYHSNINPGRIEPNPRLKTINKIARALGLRPKDLLI